MILSLSWFPLAVKSPKPTTKPTPVTPTGRVKMASSSNNLLYLAWEWWAQNTSAVIFLWGLLICFTGGGDKTTTIVVSVVVVLVGKFSNVSFYPDLCFMITVLIWVNCLCVWINCLETEPIFVSLMIVVFKHVINMLFVTFCFRESSIDWNFHYPGVEEKTWKVNLFSLFRLNNEVTDILFWLLQSFCLSICLVLHVNNVHRGFSWFKVRCVFP